MPRARPGPRKARPDDADHVPAGTWRGRFRLWIDIKERGSLGPGKLRLLDAIASKKSLAAAAKGLRMSYRLAWEHVRLIEERARITVVEPRRGGRGGGGTELTPEGEALVKAYRGFRRDMERKTEAAFRRHFGPWLSGQRD